MTHMYKKVLTWARGPKVRKNCQTGEMIYECPLWWLAPNALNYFVLLILSKISHYTATVFL